MRALPHVRPPATSAFAPASATSRALASVMPPSTMMSPGGGGSGGGKREARRRGM